MASKEEEPGLASTREQRKNAGNKMSKLLADELDEDDFYKTALGGFEEESGDDEYASEAEESDQVDSDFSISETDEIVEQGEEVEGKRKRKKTLYKEPKRARVASEETEPTKEAKPKKTTSKIASGSSTSSSRERRKSSRALTVESSEMHRKRMEGKRKVGKKQVSFPQLRRLTQQELLAEAKITEELNVESLKAYRLMEESKKKSKNIKTARTEAMIRFLSMSMPLIEMDDEKEINVEDDGNENETGVGKEKDKITGLKCSRNFMIFTDPKTFPGNYFPAKKIALPQKAYCPVTGLPAKYKDPVTGLPYATAPAFRFIREHYSKQNLDGADKDSERKQ